MIKPRLVSLLLLSTTTLTPAVAWAQDGALTNAPAPTTAPQAGQAADAVPADEEEAPDVSIPGGAIIVTGTRSRDVMRSSTEVVSVLSSEQIARTGEGDIAGALGRVTGLSVIGNGYVYVRGLGDRYSLALLNGSPLPSPEPLKRVVPMDLFPTSLIASSMVQKSYSVNFPGEFGGGVINLTTKAIPTESFLTIGGGIGWDTESTNKMGYTYYGSKTDWTGFDNGNRSIPTTLRDYFNSNTVIDPSSDLAKQIGGSLITSRNAVVQRVDHQQPNFSANITAGTSLDLGGATLGVIAAAGYSNKTQTRDTLQQRTSVTTANESAMFSNFRTVQTDNRIVGNAMLGLGLEWGSNSIRWTNLYIHDTDKNARLSLGREPSYSDTTDLLEQNTAWYERQLIDTQITAELKPDPDTEIDLRGGYANSKRLAPYEIQTEYYRTNLDTSVDPYGDTFISTPGYGVANPTSVTFSRLNENVWSAGGDVTHTFSPGWTGSVGYAFQYNQRDNTRRNFNYRVTGDQDLIYALGTLRPDVLFQPGTLYLNDAGENYLMSFSETETGTARFQASLVNHAFYGKLDGAVSDALSFDAGVRWEYAKETTTVMPIAGTANVANALKNEYFLPAATLTWEVEPGMQVRLAASKTIGRPQFRELIFQPFYDPETNQTYRGNPLLKDSQLYNAEARFEWYFAPQQRVSVGAFFKRIDNPIESFVTDNEQFITSYANAPKANLYGAEFEVQKYLPLDKWGGFFATRRAVVIGNYTYSKSELKVNSTDTTQIYNVGTDLASTYFRNGAPMAGQSRHLANLQLGLEDTDHLSQQTLLLNYASKRVVTRGLYGTAQPDVVEDPGFTLDLVIRQGIEIAGKQIELKLEGRNLTGRKHLEYQQFDDGRVNFNTYDLGRVFNASISLTL
ncbi:TonB-dependent receptor domain-containing protein [Novosphingobium sp. 9]|uniref:TonB-dependent receptor domain-containing protein n=1 Tax=Novosphingobium sp. 9 TaxID=2025349 RepID=UPI0021B59F03|nr:TonB-dependent receptor [Novosphingobium sp. 9]